MFATLVCFPLTLLLTFIAVAALLLLAAVPLFALKSRLPRRLARKRRYKDIGETCRPAAPMTRPDAGFRRGILPRGPPCRFSC